jgi:hypothetical protein
VRICDSNQRHRRNRQESDRRDEELNEKVTHIATSSERQALTAPLTIATLAEILKAILLLFVTDGTIVIRSDIALAPPDEYRDSNLFLEGRDCELFGLDFFPRVRSDIIIKHFLMKIYPDLVTMFHYLESFNDIHRLTSFRYYRYRRGFRP